MASPSLGPQLAAARAGSGGVSIPTAFARTVDRYPDRIALRTDRLQWTYTELDRRSNAAARSVAGRVGDHPGPVALLMEHDAPLVAAILGVLKAGVMYLALDPAEPAEHLQAMLDDAQAALLLSDATNAALARALLCDAGPAVVLDPDIETASGAPDRPDGPVSAPGGAWLMYTSGSTGRPKGVWQNHAGVLHQVETYTGLIQAGPGDRFSLLTSLGLAASASNLFTALLNGAALCPFPLRTRGVDQLPAWLQRQRISVLHCVPTVWRHLLRTTGGDRCLHSLRVLRLGGESVHASDVDLYRKHCPDACRLMLGLSSTETGLVTASVLDRRSRVPDTGISTGRPVGGAQLELLDDRGNRAPTGASGRIGVGSHCLSQGYWRQPEATARAFRRDARQPRLRRFVMQDVGRLLPDGSLQHLGRTDQVVKIRGRRIDIGGVEAALRALDLIEEAVVAAHAGASGDRRLIAYIVLRNRVSTTYKELRRSLRHLPDYLIPTGFVYLESLPRTAGGKLDRRALPAWTRAADSDGPLPRKGVERSLAEIWETVLGFSPLRRRADFFDLGGGSLESVRVLALAAERFNVVLPPSVLVEHSTIESLARVIADQALRPSSSPLVLLRDADAGRPLFLVHSGEGDVALYGQLARRLPGRPIYGLQCIGLDGEHAPLRSIEAIAARYLEEVTRRDPTGPYLVGGTRMGALVAFEMARRLQRDGRPVGLVALFDFRPPRRPRLYDSAVRPAARLRDWIRTTAWAGFRALRPQRKTGWLTDYRGFVACMNCHARHEYRMGYYPGTITSFLTVDRMSERHGLLPRHAGEVRTVVLPGERTNLLRSPVVDVLAREIRDCLEQLESVGHA